MEKTISPSPTKTNLANTGRFNDQRLFPYHKRIASIRDGTGYGTLFQSTTETSLLNLIGTSPSPVIGIAGLVEDTSTSNLSKIVIAPDFGLTSGNLIKETFWFYFSPDVGSGGGGGPTLKFYTPQKNGSLSSTLQVDIPLAFGQNMSVRIETLTSLIVNTSAEDTFLKAITTIWYLASGGATNTLVYNHGTSYTDYATFNLQTMSLGMMTTVKKYVFGTVDGNPNFDLRSYFVEVF